MYTITFLAAASAFLSSAIAQYAIDPNSVSNTTRAFWCQQQQTECPLICLQTSANSDETEANQCDPTALTYACVCSNGLSPNVSEYSQTLPYYICTQWGIQCVSNCGNDATCQASCTQDHPCGAQNPTRQNTSTLHPTATASGSGTAGGAGATTNSNGATVYSGFAGGASSSPTGSSGGNGGSSKSGAGMNSPLLPGLHVGSTMGLFLTIGGLFLGFAVVL